MFIVHYVHWTTGIPREEFESHTMSYWEAAQEAINVLGIEKDQIIYISEQEDEDDEFRRFAWGPGTIGGEVERYFFLVPEENTQTYLGPEEGGTWGNSCRPLAAVPVPYPNDPTINPLDDPEVKKERDRLQKMFDHIHGSLYPYHSVLGGNMITVGMYTRWDEIVPEYPNRQYS